MLPSLKVKQTKKTMLFMKKNRKYITMEKAVGKKPDDRDESGKSYTIYDTCAKCPLRAYIDLVCNDNLRALVVSGNPPETLLQETRHQLYTEFSELSGDSQFQVMNTTLRKIHTYRANILLLLVCQRLLALGERLQALSFLAKAGVRFAPGMETKPILSKLSGLIREKKIRLRSEEKRYQSLTGGQTSEKLTPAHFTSQLVSLSKSAGFRLTTSITLAEYAAYLKDMKETIERYKNMNNVSKYK